MDRWDHKSGAPIEVLYNETTPRDKISLDVLGMKKGKPGGTYIILKTGT